MEAWLGGKEGNQGDKHDEERQQEMPGEALGVEVTEFGI